MHFLNAFIISFMSRITDANIGTSISSVGRNHVGKEHCLNATQIQTLPIHGDAIPSAIDATQMKVDVLLGQATADDCYSARPGDEAPPVEGNVYSTPDIDAEEEAGSKPYVDKKANVKAFNKYRELWGKYAVNSGTIAPEYFDTYKFILNLPPPASDISAADFTQKVNELAQIIKMWYVNAKYNGDLAGLSLAIDQTMPKYTVIEGMAPYIQHKQTYGETSLFLLIVGAGLASVCFWKAFQKSK